MPFVAEKIYEMGYKLLKENIGEINDDEVYEDVILSDEIYEALGIKKP